MDMAIIVPSRARPENFRRLNRLLPTCTLCVDEREREAYAQVPADRIIWHRPTRTIGEVRQWVLDNVRAECVVMVDDDLKGVRPMVGTKRKAITDPADIAAIIENGARVAAELGKSVYCWNRNPNPMWFAPHDPFHMVAPVAGAFGVIGRRLRFDPSLSDGEDVDFCLSALLHDRVVIADNRFYFDFGSVMAGAGGLQTVRTQELMLADRRKLEERWGQYVSLIGKPTAGRAGKKVATRGMRMSIRVKRR